MKKLFIALMIICYASSVNAQKQTTKDYLKIVQEEDLTPGTFDEEGGFFNIELCGSEDESTLYTCVQMDIILPQGISVYYDGDDAWADLNLDDGIYPYTKSGKNTKYYHSLIYNTLENNTFRVSVYSSENKEFKERSGSLFYIYVKPSAYTKTGNLEVKFENVKFISSTGAGLIPENQPTQYLKVTNTSTTPININSSAHWSTCILPFSTTIPDGVTAYTCDSHDDEYLYLTKSETMEAYTPYILYSENGYSGTLSGTVEADKYPENGYVNAGYLNGAIVPQSVTEGYVMQNLSEGVKFYPIAENATFSVLAGKCWVTMPEGNAKSLGFAIADETDVKDMNASKNSSSEAIYNLQGVKVDKITPGNIYIKGGRTVLKIK